MAGVIGALNGFATDLDELGSFPAVAAEDRDGEAEVAGLFADQRGLGVEAGDGDGVDFGGFDRGELSAEIFIAFGVFLFGGDDAPEGGQFFAEHFGEADAVRRRDRREEGDAFGAEGGGGECGEDGTLERVDEAGAENVSALFGDFGSGRGGRDKRDTCGLGERGDFEAVGGGAAAEKGDYFVAAEEFFGDGGGVAGLRLVVCNDDGEGAAEDAAAGVDFGDGHEHAAVGLLAERGFLAGEGFDFAEFDGLGGGRGREGEGDEESEREEESAAHEAAVTGEIGLLALAATGGEDRGARVTGEIGLLALSATGGEDHGATVLWNCSWPPLTAMMVAGLEALRSLSRVVIPLAPEKFLVAAMASRSFGPSVTPERLIASTRT